MAQTPRFCISPAAGAAIAISRPDAGRLADVLARQGIASASTKIRRQSAASASTKIRWAMQVGSADTVDLTIGEDEAVLHALEELEASGDLSPALLRLIRDLGQGSS